MTAKHDTAYIEHMAAVLASYLFVTGIGPLEWVTRSVEERVDDAMATREMDWVEGDDPPSPAELRLIVGKLDKDIRRYIAELHEEYPT